MMDDHQKVVIEAVGDVKLPDTSSNAKDEKSCTPEENQTNNPNSKEKKNSNKVNSKQAKKERKLVGTFVQKVLDLKEGSGQKGGEFLSDQQPPYRNLLVDNRDYQVKLSTGELLKLIQESPPFNKDNPMIEDCFVLPSKLWFLLRFTSVYALATFRTALLGSDNSLAKTTGITQSSPISDQLYDLTVERFLPKVKQLLVAFSEEEGAPNGLTVIENFLTEEEEQGLIQFAEDCFLPSANPKSVVRLKNRSAVHFGYVFDYTRNTISSDSSSSVVVQDTHLPVEVLPYIRLLDLPEVPDQLTINRYLNDDGHHDHIPPHVDTHSMCTDWLASVSLNAPTVMTFTTDEGPKSKHLVHLLPKSALILEGEARYRWRHAIAQTAVDVVPLRGSSNLCRLALSPRSTSSISNSPNTRYSFTFRKVTPPGYKCQCPYPQYCDSQNAKTFKDQTEDNLTTIISESTAASLEAEYVHQTYDTIASHFSATRYGQWPAVVDFLATLPRGSLVLDAGCGNGKYLNCSGLVMLGTDRSANLLAICRERGFETFQDDLLTLGTTLRASLFDGLICIAVLHHLATEERRLAALVSLINLLVDGGRALVYVWAFEQKSKEDGSASKYILKKKGKENLHLPEKGDENSKQEDHKKAQTFPPLAVHQNGTEFRQQDLFVPWKRGRGGGPLTKNDQKPNESEPSTALRFYHVFRAGELEALLAQLSHLITVERVFYDQGNWCAIFRKNSKV